MDVYRKGKSWQPQRAMPTGGLEPPSKTPGNKPHSESGGAESGALAASSTPSDPDLQYLIDAWPCLPQAVKARVLVLVHGAMQER